MKLKIFMLKDGGYQLKVFKDNEWYLLAESNGLKSIWETARLVKKHCKIDVINLVKM